MGRPRKNPVTTKFQKVTKTPSARKKEQEKKGDRTHHSWFPQMRVPVEKPDRPNQHECRHFLKDRTLLMKSATTEGGYKLEVCNVCKEILRNGEPHPDRLFRDPEPVKDDEEGDDDGDDS